MSASQKDVKREVLYIEPKTAPRFFGSHPNFRPDFDAHRSLLLKSHSVKELENAMFGETILLSELYDSRHPSVYVIPRNKFLHVIDDQFGETIGLGQINLWFSSTNFYANRDDGWVFEELNNKPFFRLGGISQLGYLAAPYITFPGEKLYYVSPPFVHTRWIHSLISAMLAEVILARNGFSKQDRAPIVLAIAYHDVATPAGGDSIKRISPELNEEKNFAFVLENSGLAERWHKLFGFDLEKACSWIRNEGVIGLLLDILDKMSYVCLDCYYLGVMFDGQVRKHCLENPFFMDVWQDIRFTPDKKQLAFTNPERLFQFILARAYEHQELLLNPYSRRLDFYLTNLVKPLYEKGLITKEQLLDWDNSRLQLELERYYANNPEKGVVSSMISPDDYKFKVFLSAEEMQRFIHRTIGEEKVLYTEFISGLETCLDWPVFSDKSKTKIVPLRKKLSKKQIALLEYIASDVIGYYVYWRK